MSGALLFWIIVLDVWSIVSQLTTCTSRSMPVLALYFSANCFQNAAGVVLRVLRGHELDLRDLLAGVAPAASGIAGAGASAARGEREPAGQRDRSHPHRFRVS